MNAVKFIFRDSDQTFWRFAFRESRLCKVELVKRSFWFGHKWAQTGEFISLSLIPHTPGNGYEIVGNDLARSMWRNLHPYRPALYSTVPRSGEKLGEAERLLAVERAEVKRLKASLEARTARVVEEQQNAHHWCMEEVKQRSRAEAAEKELAEARKDKERLEWVMRMVSGREWRSIGVEYSFGCNRDAIDLARHPQPEATKSIIP